MTERINYLAPEICRECKKPCCEKVPGGAMPEDMIHLYGGDLRGALTAALNSGHWVIDYWRGDPRCNEYEIEKGYYVRPRAKEDGRGLLGEWGGYGCLFLTPTGCSLAPEDRPAGCRLLEPKQEHCVCHLGNDDNDKKIIAIEWIPYHSLFLSAMNSIMEGEQ